MTSPPQLSTHGWVVVEGGSSALEPLAPLGCGGVAAQDLPLVPLHQLTEPGLGPPALPPPPLCLRAEARGEDGGPRNPPMSQDQAGHNQSPGALLGGCVRGTGGPIGCKDMGGRESPQPSLIRGI